MADGRERKSLRTRQRGRGGRVGPHVDATKATAVAGALAMEIAEKLGFGLEDMQGYRPSM